MVPEQLDLFHSNNGPDGVVQWSERKAVCTLGLSWVINVYRQTYNLSLPE